MKRVQWRLIAVASLAVSGTGLAQQHPALLQFSLDRAGSPPLQYTLSVDEEGTGIYVPHLAGIASPDANAGASEGKTIHLSADVVKKVFAAVPLVEGGRCETHSKSIAKTGLKTLHYVGNGRDAQCTYNYSDEDRVNEATVAFQAIAETLQFGDRLAAKLRFDRLGLDAELDGLQTAVTEGRALEVGNIAPLLKTISQDERVMDRVRRKAERLLQSAGLPQTADGAGPSAR